MIRSMKWAVALALFLGPVAVQAQDAVTIKLRKAAKGETSLVEKNSTDVSKNKIVDDQGKALQDKEEKKGETYVFRETVLERDGDKPPTKLRRQYEKAQVAVDGKTTELAYQGKTVLIEKKDGKFHFQIDGGKELTGDEAKHLNDEFNKKEGDELDFEKAILPKKAVKVGETWKIDMEPLVKDFEKSTSLPMDIGKSAGTGKLLKVYQKDGKQFGVMELSLDMPLKAGKADKIVIDAGSKISVAATLDICIDGSAESGTITGKLGVELKATVPLADNKEAKLSLSVQGTRLETHKDLAKK
jgi:hypothetical protein